MKKNLLLIIIGAILIAGVIITFSQFSKGKSRANPFQERKFVALGASFTKANNLSSNLIGDNPEYSFATGTKINSLFLHLNTKGENLIAINLAESGANSKSVLQKQVPNAISYNPKYVVVDIMADIFEEEKPEGFRQNLIEIVKQVKNKNNTVLIGTYPNLLLMRKAAFESCLTDKLGLEVDKITDGKLKLFNQTIEEIAKEYDLILVDNFNTLTSQEISNYDCLHPNIEGQKKLAQTWIEALEKKGGEK